MAVEELQKVCDTLEVPYDPKWGPGKLVLEIYEKTTEHAIVGPMFVLDYPREVSPLARPHRDDPALVERFEVIVAGRELANAFSELNDPVDQRRRFEDQAALAAGGDEEAQPVDEDYLTGPGVRAPALWRPRHRDRPAGHAAGRCPVDPRGDSLPPSSPPGVTPASPGRHNWVTRRLHRLTHR